MEKQRIKEIQFSYYMPKTLFQALTQAAKESGKTKGNINRVALEDIIKNKKYLTTNSD